MPTQIEMMPKRDITETKSLIYYFLLTPGEPIYSTAVLLKKQADIFLNTSDYGKNKPHISLFQFIMNENKEKQLIETGSRLATKMKGTFLNTSGIKIYPSSNTIYISLNNQDETRQQGITLLRELLMLGIIPNKRRLYTKPGDLHITIAKSVDSDMLLPFMDYLLQHQFTDAYFPCNQLVLLKRSNEKDTWQPVSTFILPF